MREARRLRIATYNVHCCVGTDGRITEISHLPSQDLFVVERPDGTEVMIPFVEEIVVEIDLEEQRAVIDPPPGLIDDRAEIASTRDDDA